MVVGTYVRTYSYTYVTIDHVPYLRFTPLVNLTRCMYVLSYFMRPARHRTYRHQTRFGVLLLVT